MSFQEMVLKEISWLLLGLVSILMSLTHKIVISTRIEVRTKASRLLYIIDQMLWSTLPCKDKIKMVSRLDVTRRALPVSV